MYTSDNQETKTAKVKIYTLKKKKKQTFKLSSKNSSVRCGQCVTVEHDVNEDREKVGGPPSGDGGYIPEIQFVERSQTRLPGLPMSLPDCSPGLSRPN